MRAHNALVCQKDFQSLTAATWSRHRREPGHGSLETAADQRRGSKWRRSRRRARDSTMLKNAATAVRAASSLAARATGECASSSRGPAEGVWARAGGFMRALSGQVEVEEERGQPMLLDDISMKGIRLHGAPLYLDMQSTTPLDPRVLDRMMPWMLDNFGNPHSRTHLYGWEAEDAVEKARAQIAALVNSNPKEIVFTSGATESNNAALKGVASFYGEKKRHIITVQTEHKCVLDSCRNLQQKGFDVTYLPVRRDGLVDLETLRAAIRPDTLMVSVMMVNNEIGVIQPMKEIGALCRERKVFFHTDAAQALGKVPIDVEAMNIDLMSLSSHKIYGPKGIGALYVRRRPRVRLEAIISGGGQERGMRSGTLPTPLCVGFGEACEVAMREMDADHEHVLRLQQRLYDGVSMTVQGVHINGPKPGPDRYVGNLNLSFAYVEGESLLMALKNLAVSSGSACTSASLEPSYVLRALGVDEELAHTSIRYGIGRFTTLAEVDWAVQHTASHVGRLREMSPLWELVQEGVDLKTIQWSQH